MIDPWAMALNILFNAPGSQGAIYTAAGGAPVPIRVIPGQKDERIPLGDTQIVVGTNIVQIRKSDVEAPLVGDMVAIGDDTFELTDEPMLDVEGMTWTVGVNPA